MPGKTKPPTPPLPENVIVRVLNYVYHADIHLDRNPDYKTLMSAALVCSDWAQPAQGLLWRHVRITHRFRAHAFLRAAGQKGEKARMLREAVRILEVSFKDPLRNKKLKVSNDELIYLVQSCPYLYELDIVENPLKIEPDQADALRAAAPVRALRLHLVTDLDRLLELVCIWPSLQHLEVLPPRPLETPEPIMEASRNFKLRELRLHASYDPDGTLVKHIAPALRQLDMLAISRGALRSEPLQVLIGSVSSSLRALTLQVWDDTAAGAANACPALQELTLWSGLFRTSNTLVETLPTTLVHFSFYLHGLLDASRLQRERATIDGIVGRVPNLRVVTCYNYLGEREREWATPFVRFCRGKGIRIRELPTGGGEAPVDLVPARGFPRRLTTANFQLMAPLPQVVERQQLLDYAAPPSSSSSTRRSASGPSARLVSFGRKLFGVRSAPEEKYEKLE